ncbi:uncharacterized protein cubi_00304 [Cryptosporidium ubiquitum]|uniref:Uncharacterized protein n=1 Tax=Cryptosporidium ubiquitum TaxID=857276 RepID=A0A1J4ML40_9CRYT|nr:uncharacterized protein cubi_00304 [Cryptosporidium ubiquitum]OII74751.1 hypothetical protein cubi_00304 [Cryptosporidium ubiquitum]
MNKNNNVCLGRRGRPKKNQQKPSLIDCVEALLETDNFSFFPLNKKELIKKNFIEIEPIFKLKDNFKSWYTLDKSSSLMQDQDNNLAENTLGSASISEHSIRVSFNDLEEMEVNLNSGIKTNSNFIPFLFLTNGQVWKMAFSPPSYSLNKIFLAVGIHLHESPVSQINKRYSDKGIIQIWSIPFENIGNEANDCLAPRQVLEISHNGQFCRFLEWIPQSGSPVKKSAGLIFCVLGDGIAYLLSIPLLNGTTMNKFYIEDLVIWKYSSSYYTICSASIRIPDNEAVSLRIAGTTVEGALLVWTFEMDSQSGVKLELEPINPSEQIISVSQNVPILSASWCPIHSSNLIAVCDNNGKISIIDFRRSNNNIIKEFELPNRPITCIIWSRFVNIIYLSHGIGAIVLSIDSGDYTQFTIEAYNKKKKYSLYEDEKISPILGSRSWTCSSFLHNVIFGFNDGSTIIGPCFEFESKSFHDTILIKALVVDPNKSEQMNADEITNDNVFDLKNDLSSIECSDYNDLNNNGDAELEAANNLKMFNCMKDLITNNYIQRVKRMKKKSIRILWNHEIKELNAVDFLEVQCITSVDPFNYPRLISQPYVAIAYFGGLVAIHKFN